MKKEDKNLVIASLEEQLAQFPHFYITNIEGLNAEKTSAGASASRKTSNS